MAVGRKKVVVIISNQHLLEFAQQYLAILLVLPTIDK